MSHDSRLKISIYGQLVDQEILIDAFPSILSLLRQNWLSR